MRISMVVLLALVVGCQTAAGQDTKPASTESKRVWWLERRDYYEPFLAEPHAPAVHLLFFSWADTVNFRKTADTQNLWDMSLGIDAPLVGRDGKKWSLGVWVPVSFHMIENMGDNSNPILNTDYRVGLALKAQRSLGAGKRHDLAVRYVPLMHESSHIGDEYALRAQRDEQGSFKRVNVSYEFFDVALAYRLGTPETGLWRAAVGVTDPIDKGKGFYNPDLLETNFAQVKRTKMHREWYFAAERRMAEEKWGADVSIDARRRIVFDYDRQTDDEPEDHKWSYNLLVGFHPPITVKRRAVILYMRGYYGVNPNGQFREQRRFRMFGFGIHFPVW